MKKWIYVCLFLFFLSHRSFAQESDLDRLGTWNLLNVKADIGERWSVFVEPQLRSLRWYDHFHYYEIKGGVTYGESDEWSYMPADRDRPTYCYDVHATLLHLMGLNQNRLTYLHAGRYKKLTDIGGRVIKEVLA